MLNLRFASLTGTFLLSRIRDAMNMDMPLGHHLSENFFVPRCFCLFECIDPSSFPFRTPGHLFVLS